MKKKFIAITLILAMAAGMAACGSKDEDKVPPTDQDQMEQDKDNGEDSTTDGALDDAESDTATPPATGNGGSAAKPGTGSAAKPPASNSGSSGNSGSNAGKPQLEGTLEEIMTSIYKGFTFEPKTAVTEVTAENQEYYLGTKAKDIKYKRAIASEPMMSSVAHSLVLIEMESGADMAAAKKAIKDNVDGRKWICVGVEPENIQVESIGNIIFLVMDENSKTIMEQFQALGK